MPPGSRVLVALSGGPDSTALLLLLNDLAPRLDWRLEVAHFDHGVRPGSSRDAEVAREMAAELGLPCHVGSPDEAPRLSQEGLREARYTWLDRVVRRREADRLAVGHHADDQAETILFRVMRGTDLRGLAGIPAARGSIVRPLLPFRRTDLAAVLREREAAWVDDPSNRDRRWTRARLRTDVIPALEASVPGAMERLHSLGEAAARALVLSEQLSASLLRQAVVESSSRRLVLDRDRLARGGPELLALALRQAARDRGVALTAGGTRAAVEFISEGRSGGRVMLGGGLLLSREYGRVVIARGEAPPPPVSLLVHEGHGEGRLRVGQRPIAVRWRALSGETPRPERIAVAVPRSHYPLLFRGWKDGDRIRLAGGTRKLKKLFGDRRIPVSERRRLPVLADREGNILWIEGLATAEAESAPRGATTLLEFELTDE